jgi:hypothetical protein
MDLKKGDVLVSNGSQLQRGIECKVIDVLPNDIIVTSEDGFDYVYAKHCILEYFYKEEMETPKHYDNTKGTLYKVAEERGWNTYITDVIKRLERAEKKGEFISDIDKSIHVLQLYKQEQGYKFEGQIEKLNQ